MTPGYNLMGFINPDLDQGRLGVEPMLVPVVREI